MAVRSALLKEINETSFMADDLTLYLDTHPEDPEALSLYSETRKKRKQLLDQFAAEFEPLTADHACPDTTNRTNIVTKHAGIRHFTWTDGPLPWEGGNV